MGALALALAVFLVVDAPLRGEPLQALLNPIAAGADPEKAMVAQAIAANYAETRQIAALWSGLYWGFAWAAAALGALAGLVLKLESFVRDDKLKKDVAALFAVTAAILITVSTGGDFQRKWQANRAAAATLEHIGYAFLSTGGEQPRGYFVKIGEALMQRHVAILGAGDRGAALPVPSIAAAASAAASAPR